MVFEFTAILILYLIYTIGYSIKRERDKKKHNYVPGGYELPIIGNSIQLFLTAGISGSYNDRLRRINKKYGKTVGGSTMGYTAILTEDLEFIREVLNSPDFCNRFPEHPRFHEHTLYQDLGLMFSDSEVNREMRKFTIRTLRNFGFGELKTSEKLVQGEVAELLKIFEQERNSSGSNEVYMHHKFKIPTFNVQWSVMAGNRFTYDDKSIEALIHAADDCAKINIGMDPEWAIPFLRYIPGCSPSRAKRPSFVICHEFFINLLNERRLKGTYNEVQNDYIDYFLHKIDEEKNNPSTIYTDEQFQVTCVDLLFGGLDTTPSSLEFAILFMTKFPRVQKKVQEEIDTIVGFDRTPNISDRPKLKYTEATMLETLRRACVIPALCRTASCDTKVGNYNVKKGTICGMNFTPLQMSKDIWGDPEEFRPERFLNENNEIVNADKMFPFGGGKRHCPGYLMAKVIWISFFTTLLQRYNFEISPEHPEISTIPNPAIANSPKPFYCKVTPRREFQNNLISTTLDE